MSVADQSLSAGNSDEANTDTVELEFNPAELLTLTHAAALQQRDASGATGLPATRPPEAPPPAGERFQAPHVLADSKRIPAQVAATVALAVATLLGAWGITSQRVIPTVAATPKAQLPVVKPNPPMPVPAAAPPVRFANPFDPAEVFEFPPDTTVTQAHDAVAELLLQRARERLPLLAKMKGGLRADGHPRRAVTARNSP